MALGKAAQPPKPVVTDNHKAKPAKPQPAAEPSPAAPAPVVAATEEAPVAAPAPAKVPVWPRKKQVWREKSEAPAPVAEAAVSETPEPTEVHEEAQPEQPEAEHEVAAEEEVQPEPEQEQVSEPEPEHVAEPVESGDSLQSSEILTPTSAAELASAAAVEESKPAAQEPSALGAGAGLGVGVGVAPAAPAPAANVTVGASLAQSSGKTRMGFEDLTSSADVVILPSHVSVRERPNIQFGLNRFKVAAQAAPSSSPSAPASAPATSSQAAPAPVPSSPAPTTAPAAAPAAPTQPESSHFSSPTLSGQAPLVSQPAAALNASQGQKTIRQQPQTQQYGGYAPQPSVMDESSLAYGAGSVNDLSQSTHMLSAAAPKFDPNVSTQGSMSPYEQYEEDNLGVQAYQSVHYPVHQYALSAASAQPYVSYPGMNMPGVMSYDDQSNRMGFYGAEPYGHYGGPRGGKAAGARRPATRGGQFRTTGPANKPVGKQGPGPVQGPQQGGMGGQLAQQLNSMPSQDNKDGSANGPVSQSAGGQGDSNSPLQSKRQPAINKQPPMQNLDSYGQNQFFKQPSAGAGAFQQKSNMRQTPPIQSFNKQPAPGAFKPSNPAPVQFNKQYGGKQSIASAGSSGGTLPMSSFNAQPPYMSMPTGYYSQMPASYYMPPYYPQQQYPPPGFPQARTPYGYQGPNTPYSYNHPGGVYQGHVTPDQAMDEYEYDNANKMGMYGYDQLNGSQQQQYDQHQSADPKSQSPSTTPSVSDKPKSSQQSGPSRDYAGARLGYGGYEMVQQQQYQQFMQQQTPSMMGSNYPDQSHGNYWTGSM